MSFNELKDSFISKPGSAKTTKILGWFLRGKESKRDYSRLIKTECAKEFSPFNMFASYTYQFKQKVAPFKHRGAG